MTSENPDMQTSVTSQPAQSQSTQPKPSWTRWIVPASMLGLVGLLAYGLVTPDPEGGSALLGKQAPAFALQDLGGKTHALSAGGKPAVVNFWASWCIPCRQESPMLSKMSQEYAGKADFYGIIYNDQPDTARQFMNDYGLIYPALLDPKSRTALSYGVGKLPITFIIDAKGQVVHIKDGPIEESELREALKKAGL